MAVAGFALGLGGAAVSPSTPSYLMKTGITAAEGVALKAMAVTTPKLVRSFRTENVIGLFLFCCGDALFYGAGTRAQLHRRASAVIENATRLHPGDLTLNIRAWIPSPSLIASISYSRLSP